MKVETEIVCGFLGSGKTSFINSLLDAEKCMEERTGIILLENGRSSIDGSKIRKAAVEKNCEMFHLYEKILKLKNGFNADRIFIEYNGTFDLWKIEKLFNKGPLKNIAKIKCVYFVCDCTQFNIQMKNLYNFLIPAIRRSDFIILNNYDNKMLYIEKEMRQINQRAVIIKSKNKAMFTENIRKAHIIENYYIKTIKLKMKRYLTN